jgi:hypothetical protein
MSESIVNYGGYEIAVDATTNHYGAWVASVSLKNGEGFMADIRPMTVQPEWRTEDEAVRDAIEWARHYIDREFDARPDTSSVVQRAHAQTWFQQAQEKASGADISE